MTRALERRSRRVLGIANELLGESKWTIWCFEVEKMPAMIDVLIARGTLSESDRPHCVHWRDIRGSDGLTKDDLGRILDADAMLEKAGIPTLTAEAWKAFKEGPEAEAALPRECFADPSAGDLNAVDEGPLNVEEPRLHE